MAVENGPIDGLTENEDVRRRALLRLALAGVVTTAALAGLWWLDQGGKKPEKPVPAALPTPIVTAPPQESAAPQPAPEESVPTPEEAPAPEQSKPLLTATAKPLTTSAAAEAPPPPKVSNAPKMLGTPSTTPRAAPTPPPATQAATPPAPSGERFVVQLGVFSNPDRARELVDNLKKQGIRAHMETRVQLGPFANQGEAEKAQAQMRKLGMQALITPASATK
ncbi:MAG: SPOR domain-containing protein [Pseudomonadota bacterium]|nr:SPOR domain-containing protein [Pseudomonadota bacterium]